MDQTESTALTAERSIMKTFRQRLWTPFMNAITQYELIQPGDKIAACISGGKDSMLMAKMLQILRRFSKVPYDLEFIVMDPGYNEANRQRIEENAKKLEIPVQFFETDIFKITEHVDSSPCYLCARMRRGALYSRARELGCNKIALGHHMNDVIETTLLGMLYASQLQTMPPKLHSTNFEGMELIRPLYCVREEDIIAWKNHNHLEFIRCACRLTEERDKSPDGYGSSKRQYVKQWIERLKKDNPGVEASLFNSVHAVCLSTFPGFKENGVRHSFLEKYDSDAGISNPSDE